VSATARVSAALWRRAWLRATLTLTPPLAWFLVIYLASLVLMLVTAFWTVNPFTNVLEHNWSFANFSQLFSPTYGTIIARTTEMAGLVTATDIALALPFAYRSLDVGVRAIDLRTLVDAARSLGASWFTLITRVILPNVRTAVLTAAYKRAVEAGHAGGDADSEPGTVVLDFAAVDYINSTGIALIVSVLARARAERRKVVASGLSAHYREIFDITRLSDFIELFPDLDHAVSQLTRPAA